MSRRLLRAASPALVALTLAVACSGAGGEVQSPTTTADTSQAAAPDRPGAPDTPASGTSGTAGTAGTAGTVPTTTAVVRRPPRIGPFGDSTALMTAFGLGGWLVDTGNGVPVDGRLDLGCSILQGGLRRDHLGVSANNPVCDDRATTWGLEVTENQPDLALVQTGPWDILDHQFPGEAVWRTPGDPTFDAALLDEMVAVVDLLSAQGAHVVWLTLPRQRVGVGSPEGAERAPATDPARAQAYNAVLRQVPGLRPGKVTVLEYADWLESSGLDQHLRPDGIHVAFDTSREQAERWLGPQLMAIWAGLDEGTS